MTNPSLTEFTLEVSRAAFLRAKSFKITKAVGLAVYRSVWLGETDEWHQPIADALGMYPHREVRREIRQDPDMMLGKAELAVYALGESDEDAEENEEIIRSFLGVICTELAG